ncbi:MAG: hypothetical protein MK080_05260 [Opitutales bacterium]|nr:hypothetical protein [Opitutales bacterium]NRA27607.1 hypothetical protein [Opitutales bacterium]
MKARLISTIISVLAIGHLVASSSYEEMMKEHQDGFKRLPQFTKAAKQFEHLELIEGLPHPSWEREKLKEEIKEKETFKLHGFSFYERPLKITPDDEKKLRDIISNKKHTKSSED